MPLRGQLEAVLGTNPDIDVPPGVDFLDAGQARTDVDFGYRGTASLGDRLGQVCGIVFRHPREKTLYVAKTGNDSSPLGILFNQAFIVFFFLIVWTFHTLATDGKLLNWKCDFRGILR